MSALRVDRSHDACLATAQTTWRSRLATIPGIGPIGASALAASVADPHQFRSGREFAAWLGPHTTAEVERRQGAARAHQQDGRQVSAQAADRRHDLARQTRKVQAGERRSLCRPICLRESRRVLQRSQWPTRQRASPGRSWRVAAPIVRLRRGFIGRISQFTRLRERCEVMANGSDRSWDTPPNVQGIIACIADWDPARGPHQGQQSSKWLHQQAEDKTAPTLANTIISSLATREPSRQDICTGATIIE